MLKHHFFLIKLNGFGDIKIKLSLPNQQSAEKTISFVDMKFKLNYIIVSEYIQDRQTHKRLNDLVAKSKVEFQLNGKRCIKGILKHENKH